MRGDVVGPVAPDLVLRPVAAGAMDVALVVEVGGMHLDDAAADASGVGVPADTVAWLEVGHPGPRGGTSSLPPGGCMRGQGARTCATAGGEMRAAGLSPNSGRSGGSRRIAS